MNSSASIETYQVPNARACAHANHAKNDAQKGCAIPLNGITLIGDTHNSLFTRNYLKSLQVFAHESANYTAN